MTTIRCCDPGCEATFTKDDAALFETEYHAMHDANWTPAGEHYPVEPDMYCPEHAKEYGMSQEDVDA